MKDYLDKFLEILSFSSTEVAAGMIAVVLVQLLKTITVTIRTKSKSGSEVVIKKGGKTLGTFGKNDIEKIQKVIGSQNKDSNKH